MCSSRLWHLSWNLQLLHLPRLLALPQFRQSLGCHVSPPSLCCAQDTVHGSELKQSQGSPFTSHLSGIPSSLTDIWLLANHVFYVCCLFSFLFLDVSGRQLKLAPGDSILATEEIQEFFIHTHLFISHVLVHLSEPIPLILSHPPIYSIVSASSGVAF